MNMLYIHTLHFLNANTNICHIINKDFAKQRLFTPYLSYVIILI